MVFALGAALLLSSCGTYTGMGAYAGANIGGMLGSAIGGISGGWRGSDVGTLIGIAGGAAVGAAIGSAADQRKNEEYAIRAEERAAARRRAQEPDDGAYYDPNNGGDDRIDFKSGGNDDSYRFESERSPKVQGIHAEKDGLSISNVRFVDGNGNDNVITAGELCKISFEVRNTTDKVLYDIRPLVRETSGNRHIQVSEGITVERIAPGRGVRYTAMVKADSRLKDGTASFVVSVHNPATNRSVKIDDIRIETRR